MDKYYYKFYEEKLESDWQHVVENSSDAWMFHELDTCAFLAKSINAENISLILYTADLNEPIGICPLFVYTKHYSAFYRTKEKVAESFYESGPAIHNKLSPKRRRELIRFIGEKIVAIVNEKKIKNCKIGSANLSDFCLKSASSYTNPWHEMRGEWKNNAVAYYYLNLQKDYKQLKQNLETRARTIVNKFEKSSFFCFKKADSSDLEIIYNLFLETSKRAGLPWHSKDNFEWFLKYKYADHYIAFIGDLPACAIRITKYKNTACYAAGFIATAFAKSDITTYTLWRCLLEMQKQGIIHFDLGIEEFKLIGSKSDGIGKFKRSFGGELRYKFSLTYEKETAIKRIGKKILEIL